MADEEGGERKLGPRSAWYEKNTKKFGYGILVLLLIISVVTVVVLATTVDVNELGNKQQQQATTTKSNVPTKRPYDPSKLSEEEKARINCFLEEQSSLENLTRYQCESRGCIYMPSEYEKVPNCFFDRQKTGYKLEKRVEMPTRIEYELKMADEAKAPFGFEIRDLMVSVQYLGANVVNVKIHDPKTKRYEVPFELNKPQLLNDVDRALARVEVAEDAKTGLFSFRLVRKSNDEVLFDTANGAFVFSDQYLQISTRLPSTNIYGFGKMIPFFI